MNNRYERALLVSAKAFDDALHYNGDIISIVNRILAGDESATRHLCKRLSEATDPNDENVVGLIRDLKNCLVGFHGHTQIQSICNEGNNTEAVVKEKSLEELLDELDSLVGLDKVKSCVRDLIAFQSIQRHRKDEGLFTTHNTLHLAFTGNPGTGKTTVARIVGHIYKQLGLLSKGHFVEVSRTDLIAGYQGQTALKVKEVIKKAKGGVLFIDEAYSITENDHTDSYGRECLTELTKALEDYRDDLVVIVAGYTEPMNDFFKSNPGLRSRFNNFIEFDDYNDEEMLQIFEVMCKENDYVLNRDAREQVSSEIRREREMDREHFSNGRFVRNIFETSIMNQARRLYETKNFGRDSLLQITKDDIPVQNDLQQ